MRRFLQLRCNSAALSPVRRASCSHTLHISATSIRMQSTATAEVTVEIPEAKDKDLTNRRHFNAITERSKYSHLPSPPHQTASSSAKLAALHARLSLSTRLPVETLARCLIDPSADAHPSFNNTSLALLGRDLLGYYTSELILCTYPRLPTVIIFAAMTAYCGPEALASLTRSWGVEAAAAPGGEVDPGILQYLPTASANIDSSGMGIINKDAPGAKEAAKNTKPWDRGLTSRTILENYFGDFVGGRKDTEYTERPELRVQDVRERLKNGVPYETAAAGFVQALFGALYLHGGRSAAKAFFNAHIASRKLDVSTMFEFNQPTRDLSRLCDREGFESPVARILSETGRKSRTPVFVVGVFSGREKLGEGTGASLSEARTRAAINALKGWYLYSPMHRSVPSDVEGGGKEWTPAYIDGGEVIV